MIRNFLVKLDPILPRWLAILPYQIALMTIRLYLGPMVRVWNRNSTKSQTFFFGNSDLDLTILTGQPPASLTETLRDLKKIFVFLGETNCYDPRDLEAISSFANPLEINRDPELMTHLRPRVPTDTDRAVFLLRMLFSDAHSLKSRPDLRQRKWLHHFQLCGLHARGVIGFDDIREELQKVVSERILESLDRWYRRVGETFDIYHADFGVGFRICAPHLCLWENFSLESLTLSAGECQLLSRQIEWEVWGIYTQRLWIDQDRSNVHLLNLARVYEHFLGKKLVRPF